MGTRGADDAERGDDDERTTEQPHPRPASRATARGVDHRWKDMGHVSSPSPAFCVREIFFHVVNPLVFDARGIVYSYDLCSPPLASVRGVVYYCIVPTPSHSM